MLITTGDLRAVWWWAHRRTMSGFFGAWWQTTLGKIDERKRELAEQDERRRRRLKAAAKEDAEKTGMWTQDDQDRYDARHSRSADAVSWEETVVWDCEGRVLVEKVRRVMPPVRTRMSKAEKKMHRAI